MRRVDLSQDAMIELIAGELKKKYDDTKDVSFLINLANSMSPNLGIMDGPFQVANDGSSIHISGFSAADLNLVHNVDAVRIAIRNFAAVLVYEHYIQNVAAADNDKIAALKSIADLAPGETAADIKNRLNAAQDQLMPPVPVAIPGAPDVAPARLSDNLPMLTDDEKLRHLRKQAAEQYFLLKLQSINDHNQLITLMNAQTFEQFRAALNVNGAELDPANPMKSLDLGPNNADQSVFSDEDLRRFKREFVKKRHDRIVANARIASWNEDSNVAINAMMNQGKVNNRAEQEQAFTFIAEGHVRFSEFKETMVPNLFRSLYHADHGLLRGVEAYADAQIDNAIQATKENKIDSKTVNNVPVYTVKLPKNVTLTEKGMGENKVESRISSSDVVDRKTLFLIAAKALYHRFKDVMKLDPHNHRLKITSEPRFIDKEGNPVEYKDFKDEFKAALVEAGFRSDLIDLPAVAVIGAELMPADLVPAAAPGDVSPLSPAPSPTAASDGSSGAEASPDAARPAPSFSSESVALTSSDHDFGGEPSSEAKGKEEEAAVELDVMGLKK